MGTVNAVRSIDMENWHVVDTADEAFAFIKGAQDRPNVCDGDPDNPLCQAGATDWKVFRIMAELVEGFEFLTKVKNDVTVLGTKSIMPGSPFYQAAYELGKVLAKHQHMVVTGGGPGVMEAASKGAFEAGGQSIGINMRFKDKERINNYITSSVSFFFPFVRKLIITAPSDAFVFFPGGFGTLHQLFELLTLQETKKSDPIPLLLYNHDFWQPLLNFIHRLHSNFNTISQLDENNLKIIEKPEEVLGYLK